MPGIFLSHSSADDRLADSLRRWLADNQVKHVFADHAATGIALGQDWRMTVRSAIAGCDVFVCVVTESWLRSVPCGEELILAEYLGKTIIPLFCANAADLRSALSIDSSHGAPHGRHTFYHIVERYQGCNLADAIVGDRLETGRNRRMETRLLQALRVPGAAAPDEASPLPGTMNSPPGKRNGRHRLAIAFALLLAVAGGVKSPDLMPSHTTASPGEAAFPGASFARAMPSSGDRLKPAHRLIHCRARVCALPVATNRYIVNDWAMGTKVAVTGHIIDRPIRTGRASRAAAR